MAVMSTTMPMMRMKYWYPFPAYSHLPEGSVGLVRHGWIFMTYQVPYMAKWNAMMEDINRLSRMNLISWFDCLGYSTDLLMIRGMSSLRY